MTHIITHEHHHHHSSDSMDVFGFWLYILSDCILFATLFAAFAVLHTSVYGGPSIKELTDLPNIFIETMALLASSFTYGMAIMAMYREKAARVWLWLAVTFVLGFSFVYLEVSEFVHMAAEGHSWQSSAALSSFFALVGTHGLHVSMGLFWMSVMMVQIMVFGLSGAVKRRLTYLALFWAFLDVIWIFVYTVVYLMGAA